LCLNAIVGRLFRFTEATSTLALPAIENTSILRPAVDEGFWLRH
jgi:hypothetical protein